MNASVKILMTVSCILLSSITFAIDISESERFQLGFKAYQQNDFLNCAIHMEALKDKASSLPEKVQSRILYYRSICNGKIGYYAYVLPLIKQVKTEYLTESEITALSGFEQSMQQEVFKIGLDLYEKKDYGACATQMELLKEPSDLMSEEMKSRILLYRADCNARLGYKVYSANLIDQVDEAELPLVEKKIANNVKKSLQTELDARNKVITYLTLYGGGVSYSPKISKSKASFYGVSTFFTPLVGGWDLGAAVEKMKLTLIPSTTSYDQTQINVSAGKTFLTNYSAHVFYTRISTSNEDSATGGNKGSVIGGSLSYANSLTSKITAELTTSSYPSMSTGKTTTKEYTFYWDKTLLTGEAFTLGSKLLVESVHPTADTMTDPNSGFVLKSHYERYGLELTLYYSSIHFGVSGWTGGEALGVRNQGSVVFNSLDERESGYGAFTNIILGDSASLKLSYSKEKIKNATSTFNSNTSVAALTFNF